MTFSRITLIKGDVTELDCDAVVNAANTELWMGSGVAGAILKKGGKTIEDEAVKQGPIDLGSAILTNGGNLRAAHVIHAASMRPGERASAESISNATRSTLQIAAEKKMHSIAFPALGTGVGGVSMMHSARAMLKETKKFLETNEFPKYVYFVLFDIVALDAFKGTYESLGE